MIDRNVSRRAARAVLVLLAAACLGAPATAAEEQAAAAPVPFDVLEYRVLGNTTLPTPEVERAVYPHLGPAKGIADVEAARVSLEQAYRLAGFGTVYVDIPEQDVESGVVRLQVTEGQLRRVKVAGARYFPGRAIRAQLSSAQAGATPALPALQDQIAGLNARTPDLRVTPVLGAGPQPGTVDLTLNVDDTLPLHGSVQVNNQYTADTTKTRALAALSYDNLFGRLDSLSLQYQTAPEEPGELGVLVASYVRNLDRNGKFAVFYVDSNSDVAALGTLSVLGKGKVYGARWIRPLANTAEATHTLTLGVDYKDFLENIRLDAAASFQTPLSYTSFSLNEASTWRAGRRLWTLATTFNYGTRRLGNSDREFADKGFRTRPNYFYTRMDGGLRWQASNLLALRLRLAGQYAVEPVISNEQFSIGGADNVRGYLEAEELGDIGVFAGLQLESRAFNLVGEALSVGAFTFLDAGRVAAIRPLPGEARNTNLASSGIGVELAATRIFSGTLQWAYPLRSAARTASGDSRLLFNLQAHW
jgi:hemolysin activation/secretion protein